MTKGTEVVKPEAGIVVRGTDEVRERKEKIPVKVDDRDAKPVLVDRDQVPLYQGASQLVVGKRSTAVLTEVVREEDVDIREDGVPYLPQVFFRERLNRAFGIGQWALIQHSVREEKSTVYFDGSLVVRNCFVARAMGEAEYHQNNPNESWATAYESAKSDCITRCSKDLGIGKELWMPSWVQRWIEKHAVKVYRNKKERFAWRLKSSPAFFDESRTDPTAEDRTVVVPPRRETNLSAPPEPTREEPIGKKVEPRKGVTVGREFDPTKVQIGFGKHSGLTWSDVPANYLQWLVGQVSGDRKKLAEATLRWKEQAEKANEVPSVVDDMFDPQRKAFLDAERPLTALCNDPGATAEQFSAWHKKFRPTFLNMNALDAEVLEQAYRTGIARFGNVKNTKGEKK